MAKIACASHILVKSSQLADQLKVKLQNGSDFSLLAKQHSTCSSAKRGGDLGEFRRGQMVSAFDQAVFKAGSEDKPFLGPIKTKFGFHLIQVLYKD
jgi:peptidyl-prolyl cis-trans isomerase C